MGGKHPLSIPDYAAYDLTTVLFFGTSCPLAEFGYNPNCKNMRQNNISLMVSKEDYQTEYHAVFQGSRLGSTTVRNLISGIPRSVKQTRFIMEDADIKEKPQNIVQKTKIVNICATLVHGSTYEKIRNVVVYVNLLKALDEREDRNSELSRMGKNLDNLSDKCSDWDESRIHAEISRIVGEWKQYVDVRVKAVFMFLGQNLFNLLSLIRRWKIGPTI